MALFIRPWIMLAKSKGLLPRSLADDMLLAAKGPRADLRLEEGVNDTLGIIDDMKSKANLDKTNILSTNAAQRARMMTRRCGRQALSAA